MHILYQSISSISSTNLVNSTSPFADAKGTLLPGSSWICPTTSRDYAAASGTWTHGYGANLSTDESASKRWIIYNDLFNCIRLYIYISYPIFQMLFKLSYIIFAANWSKTVKDLRFLGQKWHDQGGPGSSSCCMAAAGLAFHGSGCSGGPGASSPGRLWLPRCGSFPVDISLKLQHFVSDARLQSTSKESKDKL